MWARFAFVRGTSLAELMDGCLEKGDIEGFYRYFREYIDRVGYNSEYPAADFDPIFSNVLVDGDRWTLIDYEWTFGKPVETKELAFRALYCYLLEDGKRERLQLSRAQREIAVTEEEAQKYRAAEQAFQRFVTGDRLAMCQLRDRIGGKVTAPLDWIDKYEDSAQINRVQIYEDKGEGFAEEGSYFVKDAYEGENRIALELRVAGDVKQLRVDPAFAPCAVKIQEVAWNGEPVALYGRKVLRANGRIAFPGKKGDRNCPSIVFPTEDPGFTIALGKLPRREENVLCIRMEIVRLPLAMAQDLG